MKTLQDEIAFEFLSGLWAGKKPPFSQAVVIRNTNFRDDGKIDYSKIAMLDVETKQLKTRKLQRGDIIIERSGGGPKQPVGRVVFFDNDSTDTDYSFSNFTSTIRVKDRNSFDPQYVFYFLHNFYAEGKTDQLQRRTTGIRNLDFQAFKESVVFPDINLSEQKATARALTTVQTAIAEQERLIAKLKELKQSMMSHLFTHGTKGEKTKQTEIGEMPESWDVVRLGEVSDVKGGKRLPKGKKLVRDNTGLPYIRVTDFSDNSVDLSDIQYLTSDVQKTIARYVISTKDIYISIAGSIGIVGVVPTELEGANLTENAAKLCIKDERVQQRFLMYWLTASVVQRQIKSQTVKNAQPKLALARIQQLPCVIPSMDEQTRIASAIDAVVTATQGAEAKMRTYQVLFKTLLHELMSGERRISI